MSAFRRAPVPGGPPRNDFLGRLREIQIVSSKPVLPAEILSAVLDFLGASDLIRVAQVSRRMREMVYDDTRWVQRLRLMGCWDEAAARARIEESRRKKLEALMAARESEARTTASKATTSQETGTRSEPLANLDLSSSGLQDARISTYDDHPNLSRKSEDGFDFTALSPTVPEFSSTHQSLDTAGVLEVIAKARSIRGAARQEYGRIHAALGPFYNDAVRCKHPSHARIFRIYRDPNQQAQMLSQLRRFCQGDISLGWPRREAKINLMIDAFEEAVSREFEQGLRLQDVSGRMRKYAHVLVTLNGGQMAIDRFISENTVLKNRTVFGDPLDCVSTTNSEYLFLEESQAFFSRLSAASMNQISIAEQVFPDPTDVVVPFLESVTTIIVGSYLNRSFDYLHERSIESYLRMVSCTFEQCFLFSKSFQLSQPLQGVVSETLERTLFGIFEPHMELYLSDEIAFFKRKSEVEVGGWERQLSQQDASVESMYMSNVNRQADKRDFLTSFKKVVMMPVNVLPAFPMSHRFSARHNSLKPRFTSDSVETVSSQNSTRPGTPQPEIVTAAAMPRSSTPALEPPTDELAAKAAIMKSRLEGIRSLFSLEVALNLVHMAKASIERAAVFTKVKERFVPQARTHCETTFIMLLKILGDRHVRTGFDQAVEHLSKYNPRADSDQSQRGVAPLVMFLELVNVGDLIQQMLDVFYEQELVATKLTDKNDFLNPTVKEKKRFEQMLDERVAAGLNKGIEVLIAEVDYICATTQKVEDFNPGATGESVNQIMDISPSQTAVLVTEVVSAHTKMLTGSTDKNMLDVFNQEVGLRLFGTLCKHLKRQRISVSGSIKLISDVNHYFDFIQSLKNKDLLEYFKALRGLSQIYLISPTDAKELATIIADTDRFHGIFRPEEVYEFAERRADWYQVKPMVEKAMYGIGCAVM
ncbi:MAG: F-box protein: endocytic membrane traffic, recycling ReCYcling 1 [Icmadophila ericetorum]|nr:F-box protein: endocytic membrane traffic, recycling ReCYcling 1 [Icmadophila ericetorum]